MIHLYTNNCNIRYIVFPTTETFLNNDSTHSFALVPRLKWTSTAVKSVNQEAYNSTEESQMKKIMTFLVTCKQKTDLYIKKWH